jgi:1,4-alpha-glucan branching enzyme
VHRLVRDLNRIYLQEPALHQYDADPAGFRWTVGDDSDNSVFAYLRFAVGDVPPILVVCNMTPVPRPAYRLGVPRAGWWREIFNSDSSLYGGSDMGNLGGLAAVPLPWHGERQSLELTLPPLATVLLRPGA